MSECAPWFHQSVSQYLLAEWSDIALVETDLLNSSTSIPGGLGGNKTEDPGYYYYCYYYYYYYYYMPLARSSFDAQVLINAARIHITAHGIFNVKTNRQRVSHKVLAPGWMLYKHWIVDQTDVRSN